MQKTNLLDNQAFQVVGQPNSKPSRIIQTTDRRNGGGMVKQIMEIIIIITNSGILTQEILSSCIKARHLQPPLITKILLSS